MLRSDINEVEIAFRDFRMGGVGHKFALDAGHADPGNRTGPGNIRDHQCGGGAVDRKNIWIVQAVRAEKDGDDLGVKVVALGEEGAEGAIDHAAGQNFFFCRAAFPAEVTSGDASRCGGLLLVFYGKGEEILAFLDLGGGDGGDEDDGFAHGDEGGAIREFGIFAGFDVKVAIAYAGGQGLMFLVHDYC